MLCDGELELEQGAAQTWMHRSTSVPIATLSENPKTEAAIGLGRERVVARCTSPEGGPWETCASPLLSIDPAAPLWLENFPFPSHEHPALPSHRKNSICLSCLGAVLL